MILLDGKSEFEMVSPVYVMKRVGVRSFVNKDNDPETTLTKVVTDARCSGTMFRHAGLQAVGWVWVRIS